MEFHESFHLPRPMSRLASIFTCLLALLVASPLCCCAGDILEKQQSASCCCGEGEEKKSPDHACLCASDVPRELPDAALPPSGAGITLALQPAAVWLPVAAESGIGLRPRWQPSVPWHAPPGVRRALLVSRIL